ncbi:MAG TPA: EF-hand domain-containing protein [Gemmatales bacterium]|nr:EF-hand domain-containing protein [Gemmatales bacterium]
MKAWKLILSVVLALAFCSTSMAQDEKKGKRQQQTPEETFKKIDANSDGKVTKEELKKWVESNDRMKKQAESDPEFVSKMFDKMDADKNGSVSLEEYKKYREEAAKNRKKKDPA